MITQEDLKEYKQYEKKLFQMNVISEVSGLINENDEFEYLKTINTNELLEIMNMVSECSLKDESDTKIHYIAVMVLQNWEEIKENKDLSIRQILIKYL